MNGTGTEYYDAQKHHSDEEDNINSPVTVESLNKITDKLDMEDILSESHEILKNMIRDVGLKTHSVNRYVEWTEDNITTWYNNKELKYLDYAFCYLAIAAVIQHREDAKAKSRKED